MSDPRLQRVLSRIDEANAHDPSVVTMDGAAHPAAQLYGARMSAVLSALAPHASPHLQIAARGQHIERWSVPRDSYPQDRVGYLKWRKDLQAFHARRLGELMAEAGYDGDDQARVSDLVRKVGLKTDPEVQTLEDVACVVFLTHYGEDLFQRYDDDKVVDILRKTARKMSPCGIAHVGQLALSERNARLIGRALAEPGAE